jgi:translocation and assembly module TamA
LEPVLPEVNPPPADLPPVDPELATPLPTLSDSATEPAQTASVQDEKAPKVRYRVEIKGLSEVGLEGRFRAVSALLDKGSVAANAAQIDARAREDLALIIRLLKSEGYYDALGSADVGPVADVKGYIPVLLSAAPGQRYTLGVIRITGATGEPSGYARDALKLTTGDPIIAPDITTAEARVALRLPEQGYPFAAVGDRDILLDDASHVGDYSLPLDAGPKARFAGIQTSGDPVFDLKHLRIFPRFKPGDLYDSRMADDLRQALVGTSLFSTIAVEPVKTGVFAPDGTEAVDLLVRQTKGPARSLSASAGYATGEGIKLQGVWTHRNLFPPEGALTVAAVAGTLEQSVSAQFRRSNAGMRDRTVQAGLVVARQRFKAYDANTINLSASLSRVSTPIWQKRWTYSVGTEIIATREERFDPLRITRTKSTYFIAALPLQLGYDRSDNLLDPTRGFRVTARTSLEAQRRQGGGNDGYARVLLEGSA